jgi:hypothetical protein
MTTDQQLKACKDCKETPKIYSRKYRYYELHRVMCSCFYAPLKRDKQQAIEAWNRRV